MKKVLFLLIISFVNQSCKNETEVESPSMCGVKEPIEELTWLSNVLSSKTDCKIYGGASLYSYTYKGAAVFYLQNPASSLWVCTERAYDCNGNNLFSSVDEWNNFKTGRTNERLLWKN